MSILLKDLDDEKLSQLTIGQIYNIMFGPLVDLKNRIEMEKPDNNNSLIAVYGGRTEAMVRRVKGLEKLSRYVNLSNGVILSGNSHWMKNEKFKQEISEENIKTKFPLLFEKIYSSNEPFEETISRCNESDIMESKMKEFPSLQNIRLYRDEQSKNSKENAEYTVGKFIEMSKDNPDLKRLVVISDWPYLLRQLLTTQKSMFDRKVDFEVTGYPSATNEQIGIDYPNEENMIKGPDSKALIPNLRSIINYAKKGDVDGEFDIEYYINHNGLIEGGPSIYIGNKVIQPNDRIFSQSIGGFLFGGGNVGNNGIKEKEGFER